MKYLSIILMFLLFSVIGAAQAASGTPAATPAAAASGLGGIISWIMAHQVVIGGFIVGVLDLLFALNPNTQAPDGLLHALYMFAKNLKGKDNSVPPTIGGTPGA